MLLRDNLQPTDFADAEVRVSTWRDFEGYNDCTGYRVWICRCTNWWFQRHEWRYANRNSTQMDPWILTIYSTSKRWEPHLIEAPKEYDE